MHWVPNPGGPLGFRRTQRRAFLRRAPAFVLRVALVLEAASGRARADSERGPGLEKAPTKPFALLRSEGNALVNYGGTTSAGVGAVRFALAVPGIEPYALVGVGGHQVGASSGGGPVTKGTLLLDDTVCEVGLGALVPTGYGGQVGVERLHSHLNGEWFSANQSANGGDPSTLSVFLEYRLPP